MSIKLAYQLYEYVNKIDIKEFYDSSNASLSYLN